MKFVATLLLAGHRVRSNSSRVFSIPQRLYTIGRCRVVSTWRGLERSKSLRETSTSRLTSDKVRCPQVYKTSTFSSVSKSKLNRTPRKGKMSGAEDIEDLGFDRKEMFSENVSGSVALYHRHVFLIWKTADSWPSKIEFMEGAPSDLSRAISILSKRTGLITKFTLCEADPSMGDQEGDLLVYPERKRFRDINSDNFVNNVLANAEWRDGVDIHTSDIFVCAHAKRDMRCGKCGPELVDSIRTCASEHRTLKTINSASKNSTHADHSDVNVTVRGCSHVGSHKFAGNVIVFGSDKLSTEEQKEGDWFGYICPKDSSVMVQRALGMETNEPLVKMWRGRLGIGKQPHKLLVDQKTAEYIEARNPSPRSHFMNMFGFNAAVPAAVALGVAALLAASR